VFIPHDYVAMNIAQERMHDAQRQAEAHRLLRLVTRDRRGWVPRQVCWLLARLGHLLVDLGQRLLQRYELPPVVPAGGVGYRREPSAALKPPS
jgi:hypothetical protein